MSKKSAPPVVKVPVPPTIDPAETLRQQIGVLGEQFPQAFGSRESLLGEFGQTGAENAAFFEQFQPSDFASATANDFFGNALNLAQRSANQFGSLTGNVGAGQRRFAEGIGPSIFNIGSFLSNQAEQRGVNAINLRNIDTFGPSLQASGQALNAQAQNNAAIQQAQLQNAFAEAQRQQAQQQSRAGIFGTAGNILGGLAGFGLSGGTVGGAAFGAGLGGLASAPFGGEAPLDIGTSLLLGSLTGNKGFGDLFGRGGGQQAGAPASVFNPPPVQPPKKLGLPTGFSGFGGA